MWLQKEDVLGLAVGLALGGAALYLFLPRIEAALRPAPPPAAQQAAPPVEPAPPDVDQDAPPAPVAAIPAPAPLPSIGYDDLSPQHPGDSPLPAVAPLPAVIGPSQPAKPIGTAGTGFFIAADGSLLTAAHVVTECRRTVIVSRFVPPTAVDIIAADARQDLALLRASHLHPPGILPLGRPVSRLLVVLGYPATAGPTIPAETWATLENDKFPAQVAALADPRETIWIEAAAVTHGFSGGPIFDPGNGSVVGLVRGTITDQRLRLVRGMPTSGMAIGPGVERLSGFLRQQAPRFESAQPSDTGNAAIDDARRATVHVLCWH